MLRYQVTVSTCYGGTTYFIKANQQITLAEPKFLGKNDYGKDIYLKLAELETSIMAKGIYNFNLDS